MVLKSALATVLAAALSVCAPCAATAQVVSK